MFRASPLLMAIQDRLTQIYTERYNREDQNMDTTATRQAGVTVGTVNEVQIDPNRIVRINSRRLDAVGFRFSYRPSPQQITFFRMLSESLDRINFRGVRLARYRRSRLAPPKRGILITFCNWAQSVCCTKFVVNGGPIAQTQLQTSTINIADYGRIIDDIIAGIQPEPATVRVLKWDQKNKIKRRDKISPPDFIKWYTKYYLSRGNPEIANLRERIRSSEIVIRDYLARISANRWAIVNGNLDEVFWKRIIRFSATEGLRIPPNFGGYANDILASYHSIIRSNKQYAIQIRRNKKIVDESNSKIRSITEKLKDKTESSDFVKMMKRNYDMLYNAVEQKDFEDTWIDTTARGGFNVMLPPVTVRSRKVDECTINGPGCICLSRMVNMDLYLGRVIINIHDRCDNPLGCTGFYFEPYSHGMVDAQLKERWMTPHINKYGCGSTQCLGNYATMFEECFERQGLFPALMALREYVMSVNWHSPLVSPENLQHMRLPSLSQARNTMPVAQEPVAVIEGRMPF